MRYVAISEHRNEYLNPITFTKGTYLNIGENYFGHEKWVHWVFCTIAGHSGGWVPEQIIHKISSNVGYALENYTAKELDIRIGEELQGLKWLNGWVWCIRINNNESGWVPENILFLKVEK